MVVLLNGSFGAGKSTVAALLRAALPGSAVYDPEWVGSILMHLPGWIRLQGSGTDDFQDIALWRRSAIAGAHLFHALASGPVIVPMTFSVRAYFDEVTSGIQRFDPELRVFWLKANLATVKTRLIGRGTKLEGPSSEWISRRIVECAAAERGGDLGEPIETDERSAGEVAEEILRRLAPKHA